MAVLIRPLRPDETASYRAIRLEALRLHPEAFAASFEREAAEPLAFHAARLTSGTVFGAFLDAGSLDEATLDEGSGRDATVGQHEAHGKNAVSGLNDGTGGSGRDEASDLLGMAGLMIPVSPKLAHKGMFWGMYVRPPGRGTGLARQLVEAVIDHARTHNASTPDASMRLEQIQLSVVAGNLPAGRLYQSLGFEPYGTEKRALKIDGRYFDDILMVKWLL